jgi:hypothetical protein
MRKYVSDRTLKAIGRRTFLFLIPYFLFLISVPASAQNKKETLDSAGASVTTTKITDSSGEKVKVKVREYNPSKAALRSAILPGLGQIYNKKYWKLPIVYGALGISGGVFAFNLKWYQRTRFAYKALYQGLNTGDTSLYDQVHKDLQFLIRRKDLNNLGYARDQYRRSIDYSALLFVLLWGLNVVDAAVDAHLKAFDVSPDLSLQFKPGFSEMAGTSGISLVLNIAKKKPAPLPARF